MMEVDMKYNVISTQCGMNLSLTSILSSPDHPLSRMQDHIMSSKARPLNLTDTRIIGFIIITLSVSQLIDRLTQDLL